MDASSYVFPYLRSQLQRIAASVSTESCSRAVEAQAAECRDEAAALRLKMVAVASILIAGAAGVAIPLVGSLWRRGAAAASSSSSGLPFTLAKAFAAGVILATGFVHMLHDATKALADPCLPEFPWRHFPFPGFIAMLAALGTLLADFVTTGMYEGKDQAAAAAPTGVSEDLDTAPLLEAGSLAGITPVRRTASEAACAAGHKDVMHIVGMRAHSHLHGHGSGHETGSEYDHDHGHGHSHGCDEEPSGARHVAAAQILELGIVSHSVIIGLSLGVSQSPCTIRPLVAALSFHQFFEGFALGGCISQAHFKSFSALMMAFFFAITTPAGITIGACIASFYNPNSPRALAVEGILDSMSAGILIYMALVDLIAADFHSRRMKSNPRLQAGSYVALFLGAMAMASLALWA